MSEKHTGADGGSTPSSADAVLRASAEAWQSVIRQAGKMASALPWLDPTSTWQKWGASMWRQPLSWWETAQKTMLPGLGSFPFPTLGTQGAAPALGGPELFFQIGQWWLNILLEAGQRGPAALAEALSQGATEPLFDLWRGQLSRLSDQAARFAIGPLMAPGASALSPLPGMTGELFQRLVGPWNEAMDDLLSAWQRTLRGDPDAFRQFVKTWKDTYDKTHGRLLQAPMLGYSREPAERFYRSLDALVDYLANVQEFISVLERVGKLAMQRWTARLGEMTASGNIPDHRDVYNLFIDTFEASYVEVFRSREYSRLQAQMVDAGLRFKRHLDRALEDLLAGLPVPTRSEVGELYEAFYDLRKQVKAQRRQTQELRERLEALSPAKAQPSATRRGRKRGEP